MQLFSTSFIKNAGYSLIILFIITCLPISMSYGQADYQATDYRPSEMINLPTEFDVYQSNNKVKYQISTKNIFLRFGEQVTSSEKDFVIKSVAKYLNTAQATEKEDKQRNTIILKLAPNATIANVQEALRQLINNPSVSTANPFIIRKGETNPKAAMGISDQLYVRLSPQTTLKELEQIAQKEGVSIEGTYPFDNQVYVLNTSKTSMGNALQIANKWTESGKFVYARTNFYLNLQLANAKYSPFEDNTKQLEMKKFGTMATTVNDPLFPFQWALKNTGSFALPAQAPYYVFGGTPYPNFTAGADMKIADAWDINKGAGIRIALFDDGTQRNHPDLAANMLAGVGYDPTNVANFGDLTIGSTGHGTATAGIIAAVTDNNLGIAGIAHEAKLIPVNLTTGSELLIAASYDWAWQTANADVICSAWNYTNPLFDSPIINAAINRAFTQGRSGKGCVMLFPSGNFGFNFAQAPANLSQVIAVTSSSSDDLKSNFSSFGKFADISAPGSNIVTTDITGAGGYNIADYVSFDGSSVAVAQVAGIAALVLGTNPNLSAVQVREILQGTADKIGGYSYNPTNVNAKNPQTSSWAFETGYGRVNALNALRVASKQQLCSPLTFLAAPSGYFDDGNASQGYSNNADCTWLIQPKGAGKITLQFLSFNLAKGNDKISVYGGSDVNSTLIGTYDNTTPPPTAIISTTGTLFVRFTTDDKVTDKGWRASYTSDTPSADISVSNTATCVNAPLNFVVINPIGNILDYQWNFGDGANPPTATTATPPPVSYQTSGFKTVTLTLKGTTGDVIIQKNNFISISSNTLNTLSEGFENQLPTNWQVNVNNTGKVWERTQASLIGGFAESNASLLFDNFANTQVGVESYLSLPSLNFKGVANPTLTFDIAYSKLITATASSGNDRLRIEYSLDCGATWAIFYHKSALGMGNTLIGGSLATTISSNTALTPSCADWRRENISFPILFDNQNVSVRFVNISGNGNKLYIDNVKFTQGTASPSALVANGISISQINLSWTDNATNEIGFVIERSSSEPIFPNPTTFEQIAQLAANTTTFVDANLAENTNYWYRISAIQPNGVVNNYNGECLVRAATLIDGANTLFAANFDACALPIGWQNNDIFFNGDSWAVNNSRLTTIQDGAFIGYGALASPAGCFLVFDSDKTSNDFINENVAFESPVISTVGSSTVTLQLDQLFIGGLGAAAFIEVSNNGFTWNTVASYTNTVGSIGIGGSSSIPRTTTIDVSDFLANTATAQFRFRWTGDRSFAWAIDNISLIGSFGAPSNLKASLLTETQVSLAWRDNVNDETQFSIARSSTSQAAGFSFLSNVAGVLGAGSTVTFVDNTAVAGATYWYKVRAERGLTASLYSNVAQITTLFPVTNLVATPINSNSIQINWTESSNIETTFIIDRSASPNGTFVQIATAPANGTSFIDRDLAENTTYFYRVRTIRNLLNAINSNIASATTAILSPNNLISNALSENEIGLKWTDNSNKESGYTMERSLFATTGFATIANLPANTTNYNDVTLMPDTRYFYRVYSLDVNGNRGVNSNVADALSYPAAPTNNFANAINSSSIKISWKDNATTETGYAIERSTEIAANFREVATVKADITTYIDTKLAAGKTYFYRVRAIRNEVSSRFSNVTNTATFAEANPEPPTLAARAANQSVLLTWQANGSESVIAYYEIYMFSSNSPSRLVGVSGEKEFLVTGLQNTVNYVFMVLAIGKSGNNSGFSNPVTARPSIVLSAEDIAQNTTFMVYPNPNAGEFKLLFEGKNIAKVLNIKVISMTGQLLYRKDIYQKDSFEEEIRLDDLASGIYLLIVETSNSILHKKINILR